MTTTLTPLMDQLQIHDWTAEDKKRLCDEIVVNLNASIANGNAVLTLSDEFRDELDRRGDELIANPELGIPWETIYREAPGTVRTMNREIVYHKNARFEFDHSIDWYRFQDPGSEIGLIEEVHSNLQMIIAQPNRFPLVTKVTRVADLIIYPFRIFYRLPPHRLYIVSVYHKSRHQDGWKRRR